MLPTWHLALPNRPWGTDLTRENAARSALLVLWTLVVVVPLTIWFAPLGIDPKMQKALAITAFMIGSWITHAQDVAISGLMGLYLFWATALSDSATPFTGLPPPRRGFCSAQSCSG